MSNSIDYYFTCVSPFAYMGHDLLMQIAEKHNKSINFKPFNIFSVWEKSGSVPPAQRSQIKQKYRIIELQRIAIYRNVKLNAAPKHFPTDPTLADHCVCALVHNGQNPATFAHAVGRALWEQEHLISDEAVLKSLLETSGHNGDEILKIAHSELAPKMRSENSSQAIDHDAIGAPSYVYQGEVFWGQDRLEYLEQMISSGRKAFIAEV